MNRLTKDQAELLFYRISDKLAAAVFSRDEERRMIRVMERLVQYI
jgi:hypothetical protein